MIDKSLDELLDRWEKSLQQGQPLTAEQLCQDHPELLQELRFHIRALQAVDARFSNAAQNKLGNSVGEPATNKQNQTVQISTEFHIDRLYASGGLGDVYLASEPLMQRTVAIKFPRSQHMSTEQAARFQREAQVTGRLNHPGIVPVHALKPNADDQPCYVMRFVDGPTLKDRIDQLHGNSQSANSDFYASLEVRQLLQNFVSLCNIVAYAHQNGIVHRDIKPANVILGPFGETMLMDWGLAKIMGGSEAATHEVPISDSVDTVADLAVETRTGQFVGTPAFASPEQRRGQLDILDERTDIYSLGATLISLLTGTLPTAEVIKAPTLRNCNGSIVPRRLVAICHKAVAEDIAQRYPSVVNIREDIERYLAGEPISVVEETLWSRLSRTVRRRSGWAAAILLSVTLTIIAVSVGSVLLSQKNQQLLTSNQQLETANAKSLASQKRATATTDLLTKTIRAATPDVAQGKQPTVRQLLDGISERLQTDDSILPLVAADTHQMLLEAYVSIGDYEAAQQNADRAVVIYREHSGENTAEALYAQSCQALVLSYRDQDDEAIRLSRDALERGRAVKDLDPETLIVIIGTYAHTCFAGPNPDPNELLELARESFELARDKLGPEHRVTLRASTDLAVDLMSAGKLDEAEKLLIETTQTHERLLSALHPETLVDNFNMIVLLNEKKKHLAALELARSKYPLFVEVMGVEHRRTIRLEIQIAELELTLGNAAVALSEGRSAMEHSIKSLGPVHQLTFQSRAVQVNGLLALKQIDKADQLAQEQHNQSREAHGETHPETLKSIKLLFDVATAKGDIAKMEELLEKLRGSDWEKEMTETFRAAKEKKAAS